jgi:hypothetical protein
MPKSCEGLALTVYQLYWQLCRLHVHVVMYKRNYWQNECLPKHEADLSSVICNFAGILARMNSSDTNDMERQGYQYVR